MTSKRRSRSTSQEGNSSAVPSGFATTVKCVSFLFIPLGLLCMVAGVLQYQLGRASLNWIKTEATVLASEVQVKHTGSAAARPICPSCVIDTR
jgi:hypothetical protein